MGRCRLPPYLTRAACAASVHSPRDYHTQASRVVLRRLLGRPSYLRPSPRREIRQTKGVCRRVQANSMARPRRNSTCEHLGSARAGEWQELRATKRVCVLSSRGWVSFVSAMLGGERAVRAAVTRHLLNFQLFRQDSRETSLGYDANDIEAALADTRPRILLMGPRSSGKSSIQRVVFHKMSPHECLYIEPTLSLDIKSVAAGPSR